jgi:hypothetical protein
MQRWHSAFVVTFLAVIALSIFPHPAFAESEPPPDEFALSLYWDPAVSRWESLILTYAQQRSVDPNLVASVIWKESLGRPLERGPAGAVGLMGVMPFEWRPSVEELQNPWTNLFWGTRALAHTIRDGDGDLYYALAAYNGGWERIHSDATRRYAASVLDHYTRAIAAQHELPTDGNWIAIFAVEGLPGPRTITVLGPQRPLSRYTERNWVQANIPTVPDDVTPHATVITFVDEQGVECRVHVWLVAEDGDPLTQFAGQTTPPPHPAATGNGQW